ncbi:MAG: c-type cytochrome domain-containing protein, partial [Pirellula sp.]
MACSNTFAAFAFAQASLTSEQLQLVESKIRPFFLENCCRCHGPDEQKGNLRLDSLPHMLVGGDSGPALVPGAPQNSLILQALRYEGLEMPPSGKLAPSKLQPIEQWILAGAPWPAETNTAETNTSVMKPRQSHIITPEDRSHWSFVPLRKVSPPNEDKPPTLLSPIDSWINSQLSRIGLSANPQASDRELVRRVFVDLTGMPPSIEELTHWLERLRTNSGTFDLAAYDALIDSLLERPAYAEHWA